MLYKMGSLYNNIYILIGTVLAENGETRTLNLLRLSQSKVNNLLVKIPEPLIFEYDAESWKSKDGYFIYIIIDGRGSISYGDGNIRVFTRSQKYIYPTKGVYRIKIYGVDPTKSLELYSGSLDHITNFITLGNIGIIELSSMFSRSNFNGKISPNFNTANITDMRSMFEGNHSFNQKIGHWDVSKVTDMSEMFMNTDFNRPIGNWDVSNVEDMRNMFTRAEKFNQPIGDWDVGKVRDMSFMFYNASQFNQRLDWDVSKVTDMQYMFRGALNFNQQLKWNTAGVTCMKKMFVKAIKFRQPIELDLSNIEILQGMFEDSAMGKCKVKLTILPQ